MFGFPGRVLSSNEAPKALKIPLLAGYQCMLVSGDTPMEIPHQRHCHDIVRAEIAVCSDISIALQPI